MNKSLLLALTLGIATAANAQDPSKWSKGQEVTEELQWTDYQCVNNDNGGWQTKGENVDLWVSPCFELWANNGTNEAGTEVYQSFFLPAGTYEFHVNGFYRHTGGGGSSLEEISKGNIVKGAVVFCETGLDENGEPVAESKEFTKQMADYSTTLTDSRLWERTEQWWDDGDGEWTDTDGNIKYYPQCQGGCVPRFFDLDLCKNVLTVMQWNDGYVRLGTRKLVTNANNTVDFANFRAFYLDEPSSGAELILAQQEYLETYEAAEKGADKYMAFTSLYSLYFDQLAEIDGNGTASTAEEYKERKKKVIALSEAFETYLDDAKKLKSLLKLAESVANSTNFPGADAYKQAVTAAKAVVNDQELVNVKSGEDYGKALADLQKARADYAMSQDKLANGSWDFTSLVAYPFFVDMESNPTWNENEGIWQFPENVTRDNVTINQGEYWFDTDLSGWRHYGLDDHAYMYCANHWTQKWGATALAQDITGLPNGYYSIAGLGMGGNGYQLENMWIEISSDNQTQASAHGTWKAGFWEGGSIYDWTKFTTDIIQVNNGTVRVAFWDEGDNHLSFTGMQLFYYGETPDFTLMIQPLIDATREQEYLLYLNGDKTAVEAILAQIPESIATIDEYYAAKGTIDEAMAYINKASDYLASHDLTALYAALADKYEGDEQVNAAIDVAMDESFDIYDDPNATYLDIQTMYVDYEAYAHYFEVVKDYQDAGTSAELKAKINEQMSALADEEDGYADVECLTGYERALAGIANKEAFDKLDIANASEQNPVDVTSFIKNPSFDEGGKYWIGNADMDGSVGAVQAYNFSFEVKQTLYSMPAGTYELRMKGLYRDGTIEQATEHIWMGEGFTPNFQFYANDILADVVSIANDNAMFTERTFTSYTYEGTNPETGETETLNVWMEESEEEVDGEMKKVIKYWREGYNEDDQKVSLDDSNNSWVYDEAFDAGIETIYYPNSTRGAAIRFANDDNAYENVLKVVLTEDGDLTIGARKLTTIEGDWCAFDNFRLFYIGAPDPTVGISEMVENTQHNKVAGIYGIDGVRRQSMQRGLNIVTYTDGKAKRIWVK